MVVDDRDDLVTLLVFMARVANAIAPFLATVLVPSPWSTLRSSCFSTARCRTLATNACQSEPSSAHRAKTLEMVVEGVVLENNNGHLRQLSAERLPLFRSLL